MASIQEPGTVQLWAVSVDGKRRKVAQGSVAHFAPAGGAPDGAWASVGTPNTRAFQPVGGPMLRPNDSIEVVFIAVGADGLDVSDSLWLIPVTEYDRNGNFVGVKYLGQGDFANPAPADYTAVAAIPVVVGGYRVTEGGLRIGGGPIFLDMQDDT